MMKLYDLLPSIVRARDILSTFGDATASCYEEPIGSSLASEYIGHAIRYHLVTLRVGTLYLKYRIYNGSEWTEYIETVALVGPGQRYVDVDFICDAGSSYSVELSAYSDNKYTDLQWSADSSVDDSNWFLVKQPTLKRLLGAFELELDALLSDIEGLPHLLNDFDPLPTLYLSLALGALVDSSLSHAAQVWFVKNIVSHHKIKGTLLSWEKAWKYKGEAIPFIVELYKQIINEVGNYSLVEDAGHQIPSARINIFAACNTMCETGAESSELTYTEQQELLDKIDHVRPIQVLIPKAITSVELTDPFKSAYDTLGCSTSCETGSEWTGSKGIATFTDVFPAVYEDSLTLTQICVSSCETSCTSCCETSCEQAACQLKCESGCETECTHSCETYCQACCTLSCMSSCEVHCQESCEGHCEYMCENACQEHECQVGTCQGGCTSAGCELGIQTCNSGGCQLEACTTGSCMLLACTMSSCTVSATGDIPVCRASACQGACEQGCQFGCTGVACEAGACEVGVAQGLINNHTGIFCNRCPEDFPIPVEDVEICGVTTMQIGQTWTEDMPGYGCTTSGCQGVGCQIFGCQGFQQGTFTEP